MKCDECKQIVQDGHDDIRNKGLIKLTIVHINDDEFDLKQWHIKCFKNSTLAKLLGVIVE